MNKKEIQFDFKDIEETNHRFQGNILRLIDKETGEGLPFLLHRARSEGRMEGGLFNVKKGSYSLDIYKYSYEDFDWSFPDLGYVNIDNVAVYLSRLAGRYYTRAYEKRYIKSQMSFTEELRSLGITKTYRDSGSGKLMYALFNREYEDFHTVLDSIEDGSYLARAFSKEWCVGVKKFSKKPVLYYKNSMVGYFSDGKAKLVPHSEFLKESLSIHTDVEIVDTFGEIYV